MRKYVNDKPFIDCSHLSIVARLVFALLAGACVLTSCVKEEARNKECDILSAWVEGDELSGHFIDKGQMRKGDISSAETQILFTVRSLLMLPRQLSVYFDITPGATIEPANGSMQDFTSGPVTYTVTSEDGQWQRQYKVAFTELSLPSFRFSFEHVEETEKSELFSYSYHVFYELGSDGQRQDIWASGNRGAALTLPNSDPYGFPTYSAGDGYEGKSVCLQTISTGKLGEAMRKPIAAGNLFLGKFIVEKVLSEPLRSTQFGTPVDRDPVRVTGYYKYQPGARFTDVNMREVAGRTDEGSIYAIFYKNKDADGNDYYLYGDDVEDFGKLRQNPNVLKVAQVEQLRTTDQWTRFEMFFEGQEADEVELADKKYSLALVFSSSKTGAQFEGAVGSTLYIDEVEVSFEK